MKVVAVALLALLLPSAALALALAQAGPAGGPSGFAPPDRNDEQQLESTSQPTDGDRLICRRMESGGPSRMNSRRVCRTAAEWRATRRD